MSTLLHRRYTIHQQQSRTRQQQQQQQQHGRYTTGDNPFAPSPPLHPVSCLKKPRPQSSGSTNPFVGTSQDEMLTLSSATLSRGGSRYHSRPPMMAVDPESKHAYMYDSSIYNSSGGHGRPHNRQRSAETDPRWGDGPGNTSNHSGGYDRPTDGWDRYDQCMAPSEGRQRPRHDQGYSRPDDPSCQDDDTEEDSLDSGVAATMRMEGESGSSDDSQTVNQDRSRRISIDHLFKAPFGWNRRRRATCAAIDVKGESKQSPTAPLQTRASRPVSMQAYPKPSIDDAIDYYSQPHRHIPLDPKRPIRMSGGEEILKSSRYNPDDDNALGVGGHDEDTRSHEQHDYRGRGEPEPVMGIHKDHGQSTRRDREGQYGNADSPRQQQRSMIQHSQSPEQSLQRLRQRETSIESVIDPLRPRRRHSELSDWPADTSPRQRGLAPNNHRRPPNDDRPEQLGGSGSSLTRSTADSVLEQLQHSHGNSHRRHSSMQPPYPPPSPTLDRAQDSYQRPPALPQGASRPSHARGSPSSAIIYGGSHSGGVAFPLPPPLDSHNYHPHHQPGPPHGSTRYRQSDGPTGPQLSPWKRAPRWNAAEEAANDRYDRNQDPYSHDPDAGYSGSKHGLRDDAYHPNGFGASHQDTNEPWRRHGPGHGQGHALPTTASGAVTASTPAAPPLLSELSQRSLPRRSSQSYAQDFVKAGSGTGMSGLGSNNMGAGIGLGMASERARPVRPPWTHKGHTDSAYSFSSMSQSSAGGACAPPPSSIPSTPVSGYTFDQESQSGVSGSGRDARDDTTSRSSVCSERSGMVSENSGRLKRHSRGGRDSTSLSSRRTTSTFRSMKEVQMQPYGEEDEDEGEDELAEEEEEEDEEGERRDSQDSQQSKEEDDGDHSPEDDEEDEDNLDALVRHMEKSLRAYGSNPALDEEIGPAGHGSASNSRDYYDHHHHHHHHHHQPEDGLYRASSQEQLVRGLHRNNSFCYGQSNPQNGDGPRRGIGGDEDLDRADRGSQGSSELKLSGTRARGRSLRRATTKIYRALQGSKQKKRQEKKERDLLSLPPQDPLMSTGSRERTLDRHQVGRDSPSDTYHLNYESQDLRAGSREQYLDQDMRYLQQMQRTRPVNDSGSHNGSGRYDERDPGVMITSVTDLQHQQRQQLLYYQGQSEEEIDIDLRDEKHVRFASSSFSISSSLKSARNKLRRTKTVMQKVKRRLSTVAKGMISDSKSRPKNGRDEEEDQEKGDGQSQRAVDQEGIKNSASGGSLMTANGASQAALEQKPMSRLQRWASRRSKKKEKEPSGPKEFHHASGSGGGGHGNGGGGGGGGGDNCANDSLDVMQQEYYRRYRQEQLQGPPAQPSQPLMQPQQPPQRYTNYSSYQGYHEGDEGRTMGGRGRRGAEFFYEDEDGEGREMDHHELGVEDHGRVAPRQYSRQYAQPYYDQDGPFRHGHEGMDMMGMTAGGGGGSSNYGSHSNVHVHMQGAQDVRRYTLTDRAAPY